MRTLPTTAVPGNPNGLTAIVARLGDAIARLDALLAPSLPPPRGGPGWRGPEGRGGIEDPPPPLRGTSPTRGEAVTPEVASYPYSPELAHLAIYLAGEGYSQHSREAILTHTYREGTLEGLVASGELEPADHEAAERAYVDAMLDIPFTAAEWTDAGTWTTEPAPEDWDEYSRWADRLDGMSLPRGWTEAEKKAAERECAEFFRDHP
jgi:hypothetical protein